MSISHVGSASNNSLVAVLSLPVTKPAGLAAGDIMLAFVDTNLLAVALTPPEDWTLLRTDDTGSTLIQTTYLHTVTDPANEPADYTWTVLVATIMAIDLGVWREARLGPSAATVATVDDTTIAVAIPNPSSGSWLVTHAAGIRLALIGAGSTWTISDFDTERQEISDALVVGIDLSAALNDSGRPLGDGGLTRTATASLTQDQMVITAVVLTRTTPPEPSGIIPAASAATASTLTAPSKVVSTQAWPGTRALAVSPLADAALLNLDACLGQRQATFTFALIDGVTGQRLGELHPIRAPATISHDTSRVIKRDLRIALPAAETADVDPIRDRVLPYLHLGGVAYPLGRFMFTDPTQLKSTGGTQGMYGLLDEMFLVDQQLSAGFSSTRSVDGAVRALLTGLPLVDVHIDATPYPAVGGWGAGTRRGQVLDALATQGDYQTPWLDHTGILRMIRTVDPDTAAAELDFDTGARVLAGGIGETSDVLNAPNRFVVIGNGGASGEAPIVGSYDVPPNAPHSISNRGFVVPDVANLQVASSGQAQAMARNLGLRQTIFIRAEVETTLDPRHDSYQVIAWQHTNWLELAWSMSCEEGASMRHTLRRATT